MGIFLSWGSIPFRFENMWLKHPDFVNLVREWWYHVNGRPGQKLRLKFKLLRDKLRNWNKEVLGSVEERKKNLLDEILWWDSKEADGGLSQEGIACKDATKEDYKRMVLMEEIK